MASKEGTSSPYVPPQNQEVTSYLHLQNSRRKASLTSRRGGVSKSADSLCYLHIMGACIRGFLSLDSGPWMPAQLLDIVYETDL